MKYLKRYKIFESTNHLDPSHNEDVRDTINDCLIELYDDGFELVTMEYNDKTSSPPKGLRVDLKSIPGFLHISLVKKVKKLWRGNIEIRCDFDTDGIINKNIITTHHDSWLEEDVLYLCEEISHKLINHLGYSKGELDIKWLVDGSAMPYKSIRDINLVINFKLY